MPNAAPKHYPQEPYPVQHQDHPQQHPSQPTGEQPQPPYTNGGNASPPMSKEGKHYLNKLMVKLNSVSRDDPQAALAQIDAILRAASSGSRSPDMMDSHEVLMNAAAAAVGMPPLGAPHQHFPVFPGQPPAQQMHQQYAGPHRGTTFQNPNAHGYPVSLLDQDEQGDLDNNDNVEEDDDSDDETSVSSITDPTYRSEKPTHEQLHDMPPPKGISTALYRRPRPNGLQNYANPVATPAVSGLELVQRHHQRQQVKKGNLPTAEHVHAANHNKVHPPPVITVTASADEQDATRIFTENLLKSSSAKNQPQELVPQPQQNHGIDPYQEHAQRATRDQQVLYQENQLPDQGAVDEQHQRAIRDHQQEQQQDGRAYYQEQQEPEQTTTIEHLQRAFPDHHQQKQAPGTPQSQASSHFRQLQRQAMVGSGTEAAQRSISEHGMKYVSKSGESYPRGGQEQLHQQQHNQRQVAAPAEFLEQQRSSKHKSPGDNRERFGQSNPSHPTSQTMSKASSTNPFDNSMDMDDGDNKDTENPEYATRSIRKLDLFMSRKKRQETVELRQEAEKEEEPQLAGEQLARKVRLSLIHI